MKANSFRFTILALVLAAATLRAADPASTNRPAAWAQPRVLAGVPNLFKVSDTLYRSAQPTAEGMRNLTALGIKTVLDLRSFHSDGHELEGTTLQADQIPEKAWHPELADAVRFLQVVTDTNKMPVLVHCKHGSDRTGAMCAVYRVAVQGWDKESAIREMKDGGYGFHAIWANLATWLRELDVEKLRREAAAGTAAAGERKAKAE